MVVVRGLADWNGAEILLLGLLELVVAADFRFSSSRLAALLLLVGYSGNNAGYNYQQYPHGVVL